MFDDWRVVEFATLQVGYFQDPKTHRNLDFAMEWPEIWSRCAATRTVYVSDNDGEGWLYGFFLDPED